MGAIPNCRTRAAFVRTYNDAWFRDDKKLYFGTSGDTSPRYDSVSDCVFVEGTEVRFSDTVKLTFGDDADGE